MANSPLQAHTGGKRSCSADPRSPEYTPQEETGGLKGHHWRGEFITLSWDTWNRFNIYMEIISFGLKCFQGGVQLGQQELGKKPRASESGETRSAPLLPSG